MQTGEQTMQSRFLFTFLLFGTLSAGALANNANNDRLYFQKGHEGAVIALLSPHTDENLVLGAWTLRSLEVGPGCEIRMGFDGDAWGGRISVSITPELLGDGSFSFSWEPTRPGDLGGALESLLKGNDPGDFFVNRCKAGVAKGDEAPADYSSDAVGTRTLAPSPASSLWLIAGLLIVIGLCFLGLSRWVRPGEARSR